MGTLNPPNQTTEGIAEGFRDPAKAGSCVFACFCSGLCLIDCLFGWFVCLLAFLLACLFCCLLVCWVDCLFGRFVCVCLFVFVWLFVWLFCFVEADVCFWLHLFLLLRALLVERGDCRDVKSYRGLPCSVLTSKGQQNFLAYHDRRRGSSSICLRPFVLNCPGLFFQGIYYYWTDLGAMALAFGSLAGQARALGAAGVAEAPGAAARSVLWVSFWRTTRVGGVFSSSSGCFGHPTCVAFLGCCSAFLGLGLAQNGKSWGKPQV